QARHGAPGTGKTGGWPWTGSVPDRTVSDASLCGTAGEGPPMPTHATKFDDRLLPLPPKFWEPATRPYLDPVSGCWQVFSYPNVQRVLTDGSAFSQAYRDPAEHPNWAAMWAADGQRHDDLKAIVADPFRSQALYGHGDPPAGATLAAVVEDLASEL